MSLKSNCRMNPVFAKPVPMAKSRTRIAVVDDDASVRRALSRFLRASGYDTETYGSGSEFLESFNSFRPQCIVLDLHMAGMNGLDVQRHLSRIGSRAPVIVITGHDNHRAHAEWHLHTAGCRFQDSPGASMSPS